MDNYFFSFCLSGLLHFLIMTHIYYNHVNNKSRYVVHSSERLLDPSTQRKLNFIEIVRVVHVYACFRIFDLTAPSI